MKRKVISLVLCLALFFSMALCASASDINTSSGSPYYILYSENGEILDYNMPIPLESAVSGDGTYLKRTVIGSGSKNHVDCGYHPDTTSWWNPDYYYFTSSRSVTVGFSFTVNSARYNASLQVYAESSKTDSSGGSFKADQNRLSKVRVYGYFDYTLYRGEVRDIYTDALYQTFEYAEVVKTGDYFQVVYKDDGWA